MEVNEELSIQKLHDMLKKRGIPHEYTTMVKKLCFIEEEDEATFFTYSIDYPSDIVGDRVCSCIESTFSEGAEDNKLEIMGLLTDEEAKENDLVGNLTAEEVYNRILTDYMNNPID